MTIAYLQRLKYLDYELIENHERVTALDNHKDEIQNYATNEGNEDKGDANDTAVDEELVSARIETTKNMFNNVLKQCEDYSKLKAFQKFYDVYQTTEGSIDELISSFQRDMKLSNKKKNKVIGFCHEKLRTTERQAEKDSISKIDEYRKKEKHVFRAIESMRRMDNDGPLPNYNEQEDKLLTAIEVLSSELLEIEVKLQNALSTSTASFIGIVTAIIGEMKAISEKLFGDVVVDT